MSENDPGTGATPTPVYVPDAGATPTPGSTGGVTPPEPSPGADVTLSPAPAPGEGDRRDADPAADSDADAQRDAALSAADLKTALTASRQAERKAARELKRYQDAERAREDANKTELQRAIERAETAEAQASKLEREKQAANVAAEFGLEPGWVEELFKDPDTRSMREHARRLQERLRGRSPGMDGGVRSLGVPTTPNVFEDQIRSAGRRP